MSNQQDSITISRALLEEIAEKFRCDIYDQRNLLGLDDKQPDVERFDSDDIARSLIGAITRINDDLYETFERLDGLTRTKEATQ
jgi:hypothetical protein